LTQPINSLKIGQRAATACKTKEPLVARLIFLFRFACSHSSADTAPILAVMRL
jgi:hypothetical protein